ncbi:MAG: LysR substrate-binding domain-containing protein [Devosia sp.]|nr:LysR substrate-binding domain-containing protein [Devosia sp.]
MSPSDASRPNRRLPPLAMLRAFDAVARLGSIRAAATDLSVTHTAVSRQVHVLEDFLSLRLIDAGPRGSRLTEEGRVYAAAIARAFDIIAAATAELNPDPDGRILTIWCAPGFAARWLTPRLPALQALIPGVDIVLKAASRRPDFAHGEADLEIRWDVAAETEWPSLELARPRLLPVASPAFAAAHPVTSPADLARLPLIHEDSREQWQSWLTAAGVTLTKPLDGPRLGQASLAIDAAIAGHGVALAPSLIARDDIASGRLKQLLATDIRLGSYRIVIPEDRWSAPAVARVRDWLKANLSDDTAD